MNIYMNKEYKLLQSSRLGTIEDQINEHVNQGWELNGSISTAATSGTVYYTQVMVREKKDINEVSDNGKQLLHG